jgi:inorganic pyrophosphatase
MLSPEAAMYQTPVSDGHNVARARSTGKQQQQSSPNAVPTSTASASVLDMEGGAASYAERMDAATRNAPPRNASRAYTKKYPPPPNMFPVLAGILAAGAVLSLLVQSYAHVILVVFICAYGGVFCYWMRAKILCKDTGNDEMRAIADPIREGSEGFLKVQYEAISKLAVVVAAVIFLSYYLRPAQDDPKGVETLGGFTLGLLGAVTFGVGAFCSALCGYLTMVLSAQANIRVASAGARSYGEALVLCFQGGSFSAILALTLCISGISVVYFVVYVLFGSGGRLGVRDMPLLLTGYGFGASFVAMFMQLGGGIYTKAADVGADLVGKVEQDMPEDDPRNPAVIADLVGDMVGDCVGSSADVFESVSAEIIGAMILGGVLAEEAELENPELFVWFSIVVHAFDIVVSTIGIVCVKGPPASSTTPLELEDPMTPMKKGYAVAVGLAAVLLTFACRWMLYSSAAPQAWLHYCGAGFMGIVCSWVFILSSQYYTDYQYQPVKDIARASESGHGTNIIIGVSVGFKSTVAPILMVSLTVVVSYYLGMTSGIGGAGRNAGLFGTAVATMGMLSSAGFVLSMNNYGPIADNAGGIAEMSNQPERVRVTTDRLDAAGNVTKAMTKGYSIGSAALACFLLFGAYLDEFSQYSGLDFHTVDIAKPEVCVGGLLGTMMIFLFAGLSIAAVGKTAEEVVHEVRRQLKEHPGIMTREVKPDYQRCVAIVTQAALREMRFPGMLAVLMPVTCGMTFRWIGEWSNQPLLGAEVLAGYLMFATVSGILMALFLDNVGGAWDNAKKYVELGHHGGKGSPAHKAAVTGDTVGDPFKDTAGPSLHVVIKLLSTTILVLCPLFVGQNAGAAGGGGAAGLGGGLAGNMGAAAQVGQMGQ